MISIYMITDSEMKIVYLVGSNLREESWSPASHLKSSPLSTAPTELWFENNRKPLDPIRIAVRQDIDLVMAAERARQEASKRAVSAKSLHRLARPHAPPGTEQRREFRKAHKGLDVWVG